MKSKYIIFLCLPVLILAIGTWTYFSEFKTDDKSRFIFEEEFQYEYVHFYRIETISEFMVLYYSYNKNMEDKYADDFFVKLRKYINKLPKDSKQCDYIDYRAFLMAERFLIKEQKKSAALKNHPGYKSALDLLSQFKLILKEHSSSSDIRTYITNRNDLFYKETATALLQEIYDRYNSKTDAYEKKCCAYDIAKSIFRYYILTINDVIEPYSPFELLSKKIIKEASQENNIIYQRMMNPMPQVLLDSGDHAVRWPVPKKHEKMTEWRYRRLVKQFISWGTIT